MLQPIGLAPVNGNCSAVPRTPLPLSLSGSLSPFRCEAALLHLGYPRRGGYTGPTSSRLDVLRLRRNAALRLNHFFFADDAMQVDLWTASLSLSVGEGEERKVSRGRL
jgi:hypothetical protein